MEVTAWVPEPAVEIQPSAWVKGLVVSVLEKAGVPVQPVAGDGLAKMMLARPDSASAAVATRLMVPEPPGLKKIVPLAAAW